jgi:hypothetical protein
MLTNLFRLCRGFIFLLPVLQCSNTNENEGHKSNSNQVRGVPVWNPVSLPAPCACSDGSDYTIFERKGATSNLLIFFSGGGACWDSKTCGLPKKFLTSGSGYYLPKVFDITKHGRGILDMSDQKNPFRDWSIVFIPYCTGDLHLGNTTRSYSNNLTNSLPKNLKIHHNGAINSDAVLSWTFKRYNSPAKIFVTGESAGAFASIFWLQKIARNYSDAEIFQLSDCSFIKSNKMQVLIDSVWKSDTKAKFNFETADDVMNDSYYNTSLQLRSRNITYLQSSTLFDEVMLHYYCILQEEELTKKIKKDWSENMIKSFANLKKKIPNYYYFITDHRIDTANFTIPHTLLWVDDFYTCEEDGMYYYKWINGVINENLRVSVGTKFEDNLKLSPKSQ